MEILSQIAETMQGVLTEAADMIGWVVRYMYSTMENGPEPGWPRTIDSESRFSCESPFLPE